MMIKKSIWYLLSALLAFGSVFIYQRAAGKSSLSRLNSNPKAKNVVLMIGDGMGLPQVSMLFRNRGKEQVLASFPVIGFQKTQSADNLVTDSAAGATAMATGFKTTNHSIALDSTGAVLQTILEEASEKGLSTGLVVTSSIVHATPAAFVSHSTTRYHYEQIAEYFPKSSVDFFIGGGKKYFNRREKDDRNLIYELKQNGFAVYDYFHSNLYNTNASPAKRFAFFTADNQPLPAMQQRDYLPFASKMAVDYLKKRSDKGFFLMIEGSQIDWACHSNQADMLDYELFDFEKAIAEVLKIAAQDGETLVIVTADHETGGLGLNKGDSGNKVKPTFTTNGHTASMVPVFAFGPGAEEFRGIYENTEIYHKMRKCLGFE